jgi:large subunit ribosomal protein L9
MRAKELADAQTLAAKLEAVQLTIAKKVGENGTLFGSVTNGDLADMLKAKGFELEKQSITVPHVKAVGTYDVDIRLYSGVHAKLQVEVTALAAE